MEMLKAIIKRPDEDVGREYYVQNELKALQAIVDGHIEAVYLKCGAVLLCNESGKILDLEPNIRMPGDIVVGTIVLLGQDGEEFGDCPITLEEWKELLKKWKN